MDGCHVAGCYLRSRQSRAVPSNPGYPQRSPAVPSGPQRSPAVPSGRLQIPFFGKKKPPEGLWDPTFSFFGRKMPLLDQKMAENRCRNIDRTCHHHIRSIRSVPRGLILRRQRRREQNFGPDTLFWKVWSLRGGPTRSVPSNPSGPEPSRAVPSRPERSRAAPSCPQQPRVTDRLAGGDASPKCEARRLARCV